MKFKEESKVAKAATIETPTFVYNDGSRLIDTQNELPSLSLDHSSYHVTSYYVLVFIILVFLALYIKKRLTQKHISNIFIEITTGSTCEKVKIAELTMCPSFWQITPPSEHIKVDIQGTFVTYLDVEWPGFSVRNISSGQEMQFDTSFKINPLKARKIKGMLTTVFFVYLIIEHQSFYRSLDFSDLSDNGQDS